MKHTILLSLCLLLASANTATAQTLDDFENYNIGAGSAELLFIPSLDDLTVVNGQGPGLVAPGCSYSTNGLSLQWNGDTYFGLSSKTLLANDNTLILTYSIPSTTLSFNLHAFDGFGDIATVNLYDGNNMLVNSSSVSLPDSTPVPYSWTGAAITRVEIIATIYTWSPILDDHQYSSTGGGGLQLSFSGTCPNSMQFALTGATPSGSVAVAYGNLGSFSIPSGPCVGTLLGLSSPTLAGFFNADTTGNLNFSFTPPPGLCGLSVQAVDISTCAASNTAIL